MLLCLLALAFLGLPARATTVLPLSIDDIAGTAAVAFEGTCLENRTERDAATGLVVTYTTFAVHDVIKGDAGARYTIKQVGGELPQEGVAFKIHGVPTFIVGEDYVLFLAGISDKGFSSPIGLGQGRFSVHRGGGGTLEVANGRDFREMAGHIPEQELPPGLARKLHDADAVRHMDLQEFKQLARGRARRGR